MSILIDDLVRSCSTVADPAYIKIKGKQYLAKPDFGFGWSLLLKRIVDAFKVLTNQAQAYHYYQDER